jgi:mono/diheme cytochrome c family protein
MMIRRVSAVLTSLAFVGLVAIGTTNNLMAGAAGDAAKGKEVYEGNMCATCHNITGEEGGVGPTLKGVFKRKTLRNGKPVNDANVMSQINEGGGGMPPYGGSLSADDKANILAFLHSLQ